MLDLSGIDVEEIATALADQTDYEHRWLVDPRTGQVAFWTSDTGIDGENPVDLDELDLIPMIPSRRTCGFRTWPTLPRASATARSGGSWPGHCRDGERFDDSRTRSMNAIPN